MGYTIKDYKDGQFEICTKDGQSFKSNLKEVFKKSVALGIIPDEFEKGILELNRQGHLNAEYGVKGTFLFTTRGRSFKL